MAENLLLLSLVETHSTTDLSFAIFYSVLLFSDVGLTLITPVAQALESSQALSFPIQLGYSTG